MWIFFYSILLQCNRGLVSISIGMAAIHRPKKKVTKISIVFSKDHFKVLIEQFFNKCFLNANSNESAASFQNTRAMEPLRKSAVKHSDSAIIRQQLPWAFLTRVPHPL